jgi:hypothetical protein
LNVSERLRRTKQRGGYNKYDRHSKSNNVVTFPMRHPTLIAAIVLTQNNHQTYENN